ncbi:MAG TPA: hypothetical protein VGP26_24560 [Actinophytocola sp.]|nr:hypothetical protein [Actinophytocola sp.]
MGKQSGLRQGLYVDGLNISGDVQTFSKLGGGCAVLEFTGIDKEAFERKGGLRDGGIDAVTYFNPGSLNWATPLVDTGSHALLRQMSLPDKVLTFVDLQSGVAAGMVAKQGTYDATRAADGALTIAVSTVASGFGFEWGDALTSGVRTDTTATNGAGLDGVAATAFGAQAYLQAFNLVGTNVVVKIQDSADNVSFADVAGLTFTSVTATPAAERLQTGRTATIRRYLRAVTTGTFTSASFAVMVVRNQTQVDF